MRIGGAIFNTVVRFNTVQKGYIGQKTKGSLSLGAGRRADLWRHLCIRIAVGAVGVWLD